MNQQINLPALLLCDIFIYGPRTRPTEENEGKTVGVERVMDECLELGTR